MRAISLVKALAVLHLLVVACCVPHHKVHAQEATENDRPALFSFNQFKVVFHKSYQSIREEIWRNSLFLARLMQSAASYFGYKHKRSSSFESINQMSDWTVDEFRQTLVRSMPHVLNATGDSEPGQSTKTSTTRAETSWLTGLVDRARGGFDEAYWETVSKLYYDKGKYRPELPDEIYIDHRTRANCLSPVQNQGKCGSCYIFSTLALYEWAYCAQWGSQIKFSEQFLVDCGHMGGLNGCGGGVEFAVSEFVSKYGLELHAIYPYVARRQTCPYSGSATGATSMGYMQMRGASLSTLYPDKLEEELRVAPFVVVIRPSERLQGYGGGLDDGKGCGADLSYVHSVLLVGSGRQDGYEYWIIRNSYGPGWGEQGYYRLRKDSKCLAWYTMGVSLMHKRNARTGIIPEYEFSLNPNYDASILTGHFGNHRASLH